MIANLAMRVDIEGFKLRVSRGVTRIIERLKPFTLYDHVIDDIGLSYVDLAYIFISSLHRYK
jgi:hypothetical protein